MCVIPRRLGDGVYVVTDRAVPYFDAGFPLPQR